MVALWKKTGNLFIVSLCYRVAKLVHWIISMRAVPVRSRRTPELLWPAGWGRPTSGWRRTRFRKDTYIKNQSDSERIIKFAVTHEMTWLQIKRKLPYQKQNIAPVLKMCLSITVLRRRMFSRRAPMQPQNVMKNITTPTTIRMIAGSIKNVSRTVSGKKKTRQEQEPV